MLLACFLPLLPSVMSKVTFWPSFRLLKPDMLIAEKLPVQGYHFPYPALARIEKAGNGYRVVPVNSI